MENVDKNIIARANAWLEGSYDNATKEKVSDLIKNDHKELVEAFYTDLEFGTGGLRGIMGVGTNRMNKYTVGMATQGFANFLKKNHPEAKKIKVAIAYDCRNNSEFFTKVAAEVLSGNNIEAHIFSELQPTPMLSFAVRELGCHGGIVITASHNPKEYNGYKVYGQDGGQLISPQDKQVIEEVRKISNIGEVKFGGIKENIINIPDSIIDSYLDKISQLSLLPEIIKKHKDIKIVFSPIHGTAYKLAPQAFKKFGFTNIINIPEQDITDGNFPTVTYPNPEEAAALKMALDKAKAVDADIVMATDPDGDRVGVAVKNEKNEFVLLNGNQTASIITYYLLEQWKQKGKLKGKEFIVKTIVTSEILTSIAKNYNVECFDVLTGFKYIAEIIRNLEGEKKFIGGGEESYGYLVGDLTRDKDAIISCCFVAEAAAWAKENNLSLYKMLIDIYVKFGFYKERLISITKKGKAGLEEIQGMMDNFRNNTPIIINNSKVETIKDYQLSTEKNLLTKTDIKINLPKSNVLQIILEDGTKITMRPSGTEPKIKFYFGVFGNLSNSGDFESIEKQLDSKIDMVINSLGIS
jgi:phosphoglucomutase